MTVKGQMKDPEDGTQDISFPQKKMDTLFPVNNGLLCSP